MTAVLELVGVGRTYPGGVTALSGVDLTVAAGELVAVVGPSGSGKSTLLHLMGTLDLPTVGAVRLTGYDVSRLADRTVSALRARTIGFVFQQFHLTSGVSALKNAADGLLYRGTPRRERLERARAVLERLGLAHRMHHVPHQLSGGERQRVAIARAVIGEPALLLADEPTGSLDTASGRAVLDLLASLHVAGTAVVVVTHDQQIAAELPRRVEMRDGRVVVDTIGDRS